MAHRVYAASTALLFLAAASVVTTQSTASAGTTTAPTVRALCSTSARWQCRAEVLTTTTTSTSNTSARAARGAGSGDFGYTANDLEAIYHTKGIKPAGGTPTIAVIDAFNYPNAASDIATYRSTMGLPACTVASGCLSIVNQNLATSPLPANPPFSDDWTGEDALDVDMASAICPTCHLMLVEATNDSGNGLYIGAANAVAKAHYISMSFGGTDDTTPETQFASPTTIFTAASGDNGYESFPDAPSTMTRVVSVGGVSLTSPTATPTAWSDAGSSCSTRTPTPSAQAGLTTGCGFKASSDLSAVADPSTGVATYDSFDGGWTLIGGTSAGAPIVAALFAVAGNHTNPSAPYTNLAKYPHLVKDVTSGSNGSCGTVLCNAGTGWDGPTGIGMPLSPEAVALALSRMHTTLTALTGHKGRALRRAINLPATVADTHGTPQRLKRSTATIKGLPRGVHATMSGGRLILSGRPTRVGSGTAHLTLAGTTPGGRTATGTATLRWVIRRR
jgi:hypothetical protein